MTTNQSIGRTIGLPRTERRTRTQKEQDTRKSMKTISRVWKQKHSYAQVAKERKTGNESMKI